MPKGTSPRIVPRRFATVGAMAAERVEVRALCRKCGVMLRVSPGMLAAYYGPQFSLLKLTAPCRCVGCDGEVFFLAKGHGRFEPLT